MLFGDVGVIQRGEFDFGMGGEISVVWERTYLCASTYIWKREREV